MCSSDLQGVGFYINKSKVPPEVKTTQQLIEQLRTAQRAEKKDYSKQRIRYNLIEDYSKTHDMTKINQALKEHKINSYDRRYIRNQAKQTPFVRSVNGLDAENLYKVYTSPITTDDERKQIYHKLKKELLIERHINSDQKDKVDQIDKMINEIKK